MWTKEQVLSRTEKYFDGEKLPAKAFLKYALRETEDEKDDVFHELTPDDMHRRLAKGFAEAESKFPNAMSEEEIYNLFKDFKKHCPQGSPMMGVGNNFQTLSLGNCFVIPSPEDNISSIMDAAKNTANLFKRRAGVGLDISNLRPDGANVNNAALKSTGAWSFSDLYSYVTGFIGQSNRRGAEIITISINHPDIFRFVSMKSELNKVTNANVSVRLTDDFMNAVKYDDDFLLQWPVDCEPEVARFKRKIRARTLWNHIITQATNFAEPGLFFWNTVCDYLPAHSYSKKHKNFETLSTNPCFSGDTKIAVADGRHYVTIKELSEDGKDVPVYSVCPESGKVDIKMGRNPRVTGRGKNLYRVILDDDSYIDVTGNHKFHLLDGSIRKTLELQKGDSLHRFTKNAENITQKNNNQYYRVNCNTLNSQKDKIFEHRLICHFNDKETWDNLYDENKNNGWINGGLVIHHKDYNPLNNSPDNLEIMTFKEHAKLHAEMDNKGEKNSRYSGYTNKDIEQFAVELTKKLGTRFSQQDWQEHSKKQGIPVAFSNWRKQNWFQSVAELAEWAAIESGIVEIPTLSYQNQKIYQKALEQGYEVKIQSSHTGGNVYVKKICENCKSEFYKSYHFREHSYCSMECCDNGRLKNVRGFYQTKQENTKRKQIKIYSDLKFALGRKPKMQEWEDACREQSIPFRLKTKYGFKNYKELVECAKDYNHKVKRVEKLEGEHTVYNITVDDNHTVGIVTNVYENVKGNLNYNGIYTAQCGEIPLSTDSCRLFSQNLKYYVKMPFTKAAYFDYEEFANDTRKAMRLSDDLVEMEIDKINTIIQQSNTEDERKLWQMFLETCEMGRRTGLGTHGLADALARLCVRYDSDEALEVVDKIYETMKINAYDESVELAKERGPFPIFEWELEKDNKFIKSLPDWLQQKIERYGRRNISILTNAPTGTVSLLSQTSSGIEPVFRNSHTRRVKMHGDDKGIVPDFVDENGIAYREFEVFHKNVQEYMDMHETDELPDYFVESNNIDWNRRVELQSVIQKHIDHSISSTVNLPRGTKPEVVGELYMSAWEHGLKGITVYVEGSRSGILISEDERKKKEGIQYIDAYKRPEVLECDIHHSTNGWIFFVSLLNGKPYEIFGGPKKQVPVGERQKKGILTKRKLVQTNSEYDLRYSNRELKNIGAYFNEHGYVDITRLVSMNLRHGVKPSFIVDQLSKNKVSDFFSFNKAICRVLKKYIEDDTTSGVACVECGEKTMVYEGGCSVCTNCGYSACS